MGVAHTHLRTYILYPEGEHGELHICPIGQCEGYLTERGVPYSQGTKHPWHNWNRVVG